MPPDPPGATRRLTFDARDDRAPAWTADGTEIVYARGSVVSSGAGSSALLSIPAEGGLARVLFPELQGEDGTFGRAFATPALEPLSGRVAFQHRIRLAPSVGCGETYWLCESSDPPIPPTVGGVGETDPPPPHPAIEELALRVRRPGATGPLEEDPAVRVLPPRRTEDPGAGNPPLFGNVIGRVFVEWFPAQALFAADGTPYYRPAWSPDGSTLVFGDGYGLRSWHPGESESTRIPGTSDGIMPTWSPDGAWIAFARLGRSEPETDLCGNFDLAFDPTLGEERYFPYCVQETTDYGLGQATVELVRPDGSETRVIGPGLDPAWTPDGRFLYVVRGGQVWRIPLEGAAPEQLVPGTDGGREPAVSPDGSQLALSRLSSDGWDIWVVPALP